MIRTANYEPCLLARETQKLLDKRLASIDMEVAPPSEILDKRPPYYRSFPLLEKSALNQECASRYAKYATVHECGVDKRG